jgi:ATP-dependent DNA helicase RecG
LLLSSENEIIEFKEAKSDFDFNKIWKYFSALSNEANLHKKKEARLVFGIDDKWNIVGTSYKDSDSSLQNLKIKIWDKTNNRMTFQEIFVDKKNNKRVILFKIPPALKWIPTAWEGQYYGRDWDSLQPLSLEKLDRIRNQWIIDDFSIKICEWATIDDLDKSAIKKARELYFQKNPSKKTENWDDVTFLNKVKVTIKWKITNTAIILLWKPESEHFLSPAIAKISWILKNRDNIEIDYEHFSCPFILTIDKVYQKIRNLKYRYIKDGTLFPEEVDKYDPFIIREALNNCIAHQDYTLGWKINVIEKEDCLIFSNSWTFIPETIENVVKSDSPSEYYRNRFLADAMVNLNMIDTIWSWIKKMFTLQRNKFFPLPEYELSNNKVSVTIIWKILDLNYARKLAQVPDLSLIEIMLLDKVQKHKELNKNEIKLLKKKNLIEWKKSNIYISAEVASYTWEKSEYIKQRWLKDSLYKNYILEYLSKYNQASKKDIDNLIYSMLPTILNEKQKKNKISNILYSMSKKDNTIKNIWTNRYPIWKKFN